MKKSEIKNLLKLAKPCPFCGSKAVFITSREFLLDKNDLNSLRVEITLGCGEERGYCSVRPRVGGAWEENDGDIKSLLLLWNKRSKRVDVQS